MSQEAIATRELLTTASNDDLGPLVEYILKASTESLTASPKYKKYHLDHTQYTDEIFDEIRQFGGNTFVNLFRKEGPSYLDVLKDAAKKVGVKDADKYSIVELEQQMIQALLRKATKEASGEDQVELEKVLRDVGLNERDYKAFISGASLATLLTPQLYRLFMYQASSLIAGAVAKQLLGHGLRVGIGFTAGRFGSLLLGPIGWVLAGIWTAVDIAGPAYRVTVPCTLHIAMLRQKWLCEQEVGPLEEAFND
ncbi:hypothetical protein HBJ58_16945 [Halomonas desiderata]|uniref:YaaW family protein n=1 Tax=Billgrantia desiderata TaxID=52021 RepID=UPI00174AD46A|nr:hypothetical protein [Halomonas desiderata]